MAPVPSNTKSRVVKKAPTIIGKAAPKAIGKAKAAADRKAKVVAERPPAFKIETSHGKSRYFKGLIYGEHGAGKTRLVATSSGVPEMRDVFMIDAEAGDMTLEDMDEKDEFKFGDIDVVQVKSYKQVAAVQEFLKTHCRLRVEVEVGPYGGKDLEPDKSAIDKLRALEARFKGVEPSDIDEPRRYRTLLLDSIGEVESLLIYQLLGVTELTSLDEEIQAEEWAEYKKNNNMIKRLVRELRNLPMHLLITCPAKYAQDEKKRMLYTP
ncbi:hypothetical protein LCGC14_2439480, partial [marine sediment metagenome]